MTNIIGEALNFLYSHTIGRLFQPYSREVLAGGEKEAERLAAVLGIVETRVFMHALVRGGGPTAAELYLLRTQGQTDVKTLASIEAPLSAGLQWMLSKYGTQPEIVRTAEAARDWYVRSSTT